MFPTAIEPALAETAPRQDLNCASLSFLRSWTGSTVPNSALPSRSSGWPGRITGASNCTRKEISQLNGVRLASAVSPNEPGIIRWHQVSSIPGPHLLKYLWWFFANYWQRRRDKRSGRVRPDLVYSPGINCPDADVIVVHIVFHEFYERVRSGLALHRLPVLTWPRVVHRKLYYKLVMFLERKIYGNPRVRLVAVSSLVAAQLKSHFPPCRTSRSFPMLWIRSDLPRGREWEKRDASRQSLSYAERDFVLLLIGNDWKTKGLDTSPQGHCVAQRPSLAHACCRQ